MESGDNDIVELHCNLIVFIPLAIVHIHTRLVGGRDMYNLEMNVFEIEFILNCISDSINDSNIYENRGLVKITRLRN